MEQTRVDSTTQQQPGKMMTRSKMTTRDLELKLKSTLEELIRVKELNSRLIQERDECEVEIKTIIDKNSVLKNELAELDIQCEDIRSHRDQLLDIVSSYDECEEHISALSRIQVLEQQLRAANLQIEEFQQVQQAKDCNNTLSLYNELLHSGNSDSVTIDLTSDSENVDYKVSNNKFKMYNKINRHINKINKKLVSNKKQLKTCLSKTKQTHNLRLLCTDLENQLSETIQNRDRDVLSLNLMITNLKSELSDLSSKYKLSEREMSENELTLNKIISLGKQNLEAIEALDYSNCPKCLQSSDSISIVRSKNSCSESSVIDLVPTTYVFSDRIGSNLGSLLSNKLEHKTVNICMPGASYVQIVERMGSLTYKEMDNIIVFVGNSIGVKISHIISSFEVLNQLYVNKVLVCGFPYSNKMSFEHNKYVHKLNNTIHNCTFGLRDRVSLFDTSKFINSKSFILTKYNMYLSKYIKDEIATLLAYNLHNYVIPSITSICSSANTLAVIKTGASFELPHSDNLEPVPTCNFLI